MGLREIDPVMIELEATVGDRRTKPEPESREWGTYTPMNVKIPWSNPRAVISTILKRSGQLERETPRQYKRIDSPFGRT